MDVKNRLQTLMDERGWTIYRLAQESDIPWSTIRNAFKRNTEPSVATLERICHGMGITLSEFFDEGKNEEVSEAHSRLVSGWNKLSPKDQRLVLDLIDSLND